MSQAGQAGLKIREQLGSAFLQHRGLNCATAYSCNEYYERQPVSNHIRTSMAQHRPGCATCSGHLVHPPSIEHGYALQEDQCQDGSIRLQPFRMHRLHQIECRDALPWPSISCVQSPPHYLCNVRFYSLMDNGHLCAEGVDKRPYSRRSQAWHELQGGNLVIVRRTMGGG